MKRGSVGQTEGSKGSADVQNPGGTTYRFGGIAKQVASSVALAAVAFALYLWTLLRIRAYQPHYPDLVVLGVFTPPQPIHLAHSLFPPLFLVTSAVVAAFSVRVVRGRQPGIGTTVAFVVHWVVIGAFVLMFLWASLWLRNASGVMRHFG